MLIKKVVIDNKELIKVESAKSLGMIIDRKLNWIDHITYVKNKISKVTGIMYKARQFLSKRALLDLYYAYIYSCMIYSIKICGCVSQTQLNCLLPLFAAKVYYTAAYRDIHLTFSS